MLVNFRGGIGDFLLLTPVLRSLFENSGYRLFFLGNEELVPLVSGYDFFDGTFPVPYGSSFPVKAGAVIRSIGRLRGIGFQCCIVPVCSHGRLSSLVTRFSGAERRIGFRHGPATRVHTDIIDLDENRHDIELNMKILDVLNVKAATTETELHVPEGSVQLVEGWFASEKIDRHGTLVAVAPLVKGMAGYPSKEWPLEKFSLLVQDLMERSHAGIVLTGSAGELDRLRRSGLFKTNDRLHFHDRSFSIYDTAALLKECSFIVCNDSGIMHVARAVGTPIVSVWGPTSPERWGYPGRRDFVAVRSDSCSPCRAYGKRTNCRHRKCLEEITIDEVLGACEGLLK